MSTTFPRARGSRRGYDVDEVEDFLEEARRAFDGEPGSSEWTSERIRRVAFTLRRGGYDTSEVDTVLERLEDVFAQRELDQAVDRDGQELVYGGARATAQAILDRAVRPRGQRFRRAGPFTPGYAVREVDALADRIAAYIQDGRSIDLAALREVAFAAQRGGYQEAQVDLFIDAMVEVLLTVRS